MGIKKNILVLLVITLFFSCQSLIGDIDEAEESGFDIQIRNYSDISYIGATIYIGAINEKNNYVALDSLVYKDLYITNRNENGEIDSSNRMFSTTIPFKGKKQQLTKFSTWAPPSKNKINKINAENIISLKLKLHNKQHGIFYSDIYRHGFINAVILEDGSIE